MTMGLKIHRMLRDEINDPPELVEEAKKRRAESDSILETIYNKIVKKRSDKRKSGLIEDDDDDL